MIVMEYADNGSLLSYLDQNINKLTWYKKLKHLVQIAYYLNHIHGAGLVHCNFHGGNIVLHKRYSVLDVIEALICDLGLSQSVNSCQQNYRLLHPSFSLTISITAPQKERKISLLL